jgi:hypothetical protein
MDENTQNLSSDELEGLEGIDDVEAHGLKEVAIGLGAAAVIGGGGAGVALASAGGPVTPGPAPVTHAVSHVVTGAENTLSRHTPQGPPAATTNSYRLPSPPHVDIAHHHIVPVPVGFEGNKSSDVPVGQPVATVEGHAKQAAKQLGHAGKTAQETVDHTTSPIVESPIPPAQR